ncbi:MAG: pantetheine-phosphate adenylyltransferase [Candidatus Nanoarchaeia archaeon]|nr:pantetheine-phosphate adenylyltransferase [Candidatus Jingweiarchaeum tengchongense]
MSKLYKKVAVGGTWDRLHKGHDVILKKTFEIGENIYIGVVASEELLKQKELKEIIEPYEKRVDNLLEYIRKLNPNKKFKIIPLYDKYSITTSDPELEALVVSQLTLESGKEINEIRKKRGLKELDLIVVDMVLAEDNGLLCSTRIRKNEIDREGKLIKKGSYHRA